MAILQTDDFPNDSPFDVAGFFLKMKCYALKAGRKAAVPVLLFFMAIGCTGNRITGRGGTDTLYYPLDSIPADSEKIHIAASEDGNMKFYCWDTGQGDSVPVYGVLCQFRTEDGGARVVDMYDGPWIDHVHAIRRDNGTNYYIAQISHRPSRSTGFVSLWGYVIEGDTVREVNALDGSDDLDICPLEFEYDLLDWEQRKGNGERVDLYRYDAERQLLYMPIAKNVDSSVRFLDDYRILHFDGTRFVVMKEDTVITGN